MEVISYRPAKSRLPMNEWKWWHDEVKRLWQHSETDTQLSFWVSTPASPANVLASSMAAMTCQLMHEIWGAAIVVGWPTQTMINAAHGSSTKGIRSPFWQLTIAFHIILFGLFLFATQYANQQNLRIFHVLSTKPHSARDTYWETWKIQRI